MNSRERFRKQMRFERVDRPVRWETLGFWGNTKTRWQKEGLPEDVEPGDYFGVEPRCLLEVNSGFVSLPFDPPFDHEELVRTASHVTYKGRDGIVRRERADCPELSMPQWIRFPVETRADFEKLRDERLNADTPSRYPDWQKINEKYSDYPYPVGLAICGAYGSPRNFFGEENLAYVYFDDPELVHEIMRWWVDFYKNLVSRVTRHFTGVDYIFLWEDMAFKNGPLISPAFAKRFMVPYYEDLFAHIRSCGIRFIHLDTDGNAESLLPLFVDAGVDVFFPMEIAAGMDPLKIRKQFGHRLGLIGGIDKRAVAEGGEIMRKEVMRKVPDLLQDGGYIPGEDHLTPPDTSFENFRAFIELVRELGDKYGG
jgi:uroporphyrinogen decarboxylase